MGWEWTGKLFNNLRQDKGWNLILKTIVWVIIVMVSMIFLTHLVEGCNGKYTRLWQWERNKFQPCTDTLSIHDTMMQYDTIWLPTAHKQPVAKAKNNNSGNAQVVGDINGKNINLGNTEHVGDNIYEERGLSAREVQSLTYAIDNVRIRHKLQKKIWFETYPGAQPKVIVQIHQILKDSGYEIVANVQGVGNEPVKGIDVRPGIPFCTDCIFIGIGIL